MEKLREVDVIIVGQGLAGSSLAYELIKRDQKVVVIDRQDEGSSSRVAAGLITPLTGKGMNPAWRQEEYLSKAIEHYQELADKTGQCVYFPQPVLRAFSSQKERAKWLTKKGEQDRWAEEVDSLPEPILSEHGAIVMPDGAWVDTLAYLSVIRGLLVEHEAIINADFKQSEVSVLNDGVEWRGIVARKIILCQGAYGLKKQMHTQASGHSNEEGGDKQACEQQAEWFGDVIHRSAKGEILTLKINGLDESSRYHAQGWLAPRGGNHWKAGASYDWQQLNSETTAEGRDQILTRLRSWIKPGIELEVVDHAAGVRPIIRNSRPVVGFHKEHSQLGFFNGLGSKGALMAPAVAAHLAQHLCGECALDEELDYYRSLSSPAAGDSTKDCELHRAMRVEIITGSLLHCAHRIISSVVKHGDTVVDATLGNGHDTLFLAGCVGAGKSDGLVIGYDIQPEALLATRERLETAGIDSSCYELHEESHEMLARNSAKAVAAVMFNLGYLPSGDKEIITLVDSTMRALASAAKKLSQGGVLSVMCYPGHAGGDSEALTVKGWFESLDTDDYKVTMYQRQGAKATTPYLLIAKKR